MAGCARISAARNSLRVALANLRQAVGDDTLSADRQVVQLRLDSSALDVASFRELLEASRAHCHDQNNACSACAARLAQAVVLYRGDFLAGFGLPDADTFEEWVLVRRETLRLQVLDALAALAEHHGRVGDSVALVRDARRQLELEPWHEPAQRQLMRGLAMSGDRDAALAQYARCRQLLADELGVEPEAETRALHEQIRSGQLSPVKRDAAAPRYNLPAALTPFVGREAELATLGALLAQGNARLLTLVGVGGMGKSRLALELARANLDAYADGVFFVAFAPISDFAALPAAIAQALDLTIDGSDPTAALLRFLRDKHLLLVLDNFEHLRAGAGLLMELLAAAPRLQLLVTSRERLLVRGEQLFAIDGLAYGHGAVTAQAETLPAVRLFSQSARRVQHGFQVDASNLPGVLRICTLVQGMPLALELAASWAELLSVDEIAQEIARSAAFLAADWSATPERQRSMRAVFEWSWGLLDSTEQQLFGRLAVFRGGFTRAAAEAVADASLASLASLVQKSLLRRTDDAAGAGRYEIHDLLRQFGAEQLAARPDAYAALEERHSAFYCAFVQQRGSRLARHDPQHAAAEIRIEINNVRQAWAWAAANARAADLDRSLYGLWQFYWLVGLSIEGDEQFGLAAAHLRRASGYDRAEHSGLVSKLLAVQALFMNRHCIYDQAAQVAQQAITAARAGGSAFGEAMGHACWGQALYRKGLMGDARPRIEQALERARDAQRTDIEQELLCEVELEALQWLGMLDKDAGGYEASRAHLTEALKICDLLDKRREECRYLVDMGEIATILATTPPRRRLLARRCASLAPAELAWRRVRHSWGSASWRWQRDT